MEKFFGAPPNVPDLSHLPEAGSEEAKALLVQAADNHLRRIRPLFAVDDAQFAQLETEVRGLLSLGKFPQAFEVTANFIIRMKNLAMEQ